MHISSLLNPGIAHCPIQSKYQAAQCLNDNLNLYGNLGKWQREISFITHSRIFNDSLLYVFLSVPPPHTGCQPPSTIPSCQMPDAKENSLLPACSGCASLLPLQLIWISHIPGPLLPQTEPRYWVWAISISLNPGKQNKASKDRLLLPTQGSRSCKYSDILPCVKHYWLCCFIFLKVIGVWEAASKMFQRSHKLNYEKCTDHHPLIWSRNSL